MQSMDAIIIVKSSDTDLVVSGFIDSFRHDFNLISDLRNKTVCFLIVFLDDTTFRELICDVIRPSVVHA